MIPALYSARERDLPRESVKDFILSLGTYVFFTPLIVSEVAVGVRGVVVFGVVIGVMVFADTHLPGVYRFGFAELEYILPPRVAA